MRQKTIFNKAIFQDLLDTSSLNEKKLLDCSRKLLYLAQNFEKELPGLKNLKDIYIPQLNKFVNLWTTKWLCSNEHSLLNFKTFDGLPIVDLSSETLSKQESI